MWDEIWLKCKIYHHDSTVNSYSNSEKDEIRRTAYGTKHIKMNMFTIQAKKEISTSSITTITSAYTSLLVSMIDALITLAHSNVSPLGEKKSAQTGGD